jgi:hypothetical protein
MAFGSLPQFQAALPFYGFQGANRHIPPWMRHGRHAGFHRMPEMVMAACDPDQFPAVAFKHPDDIPAVHPVVIYTLYTPRQQKSTIFYVKSSSAGRSSASSGRLGSAPFNGFGVFRGCPCPDTPKERFTAVRAYNADKQAFALNHLLYFRGVNRHAMPIPPRLKNMGKWHLNRVNNEGLRAVLSKPTTYEARTL